MAESAAKVKSEIGKWTDDEVESIMDLYESRPCLWDIFSKDYRKRDFKEKALNEISEEIFIPVEEIKQKWLSHRAQYGRELTNSKKQKSGQSTDELYVSQWIFYDKMHFLQPMMKTKKSRDSIDLCDSCDPVNSPNTSIYGDDEQTDGFPVAGSSKQKPKLDDTKQKLLSVCLEVLKKNILSVEKKEEPCYFSMRMAEKLKSFT